MSQPVNPMANKLILFANLGVSVNNIVGERVKTSGHTKSDRVMVGNPIFASINHQLDVSKHQQRGVVIFLFFGTYYSPLQPRTRTQTPTLGHFQIEPWLHTHRIRRRLLDSIQRLQSLGYYWKTHSSHSLTGFHIREYAVYYVLYPWSHIYSLWPCSHCGHHPRRLVYIFNQLGSSQIKQIS